LHLAPIPGYDLAIFHAMARVILDEKLYDQSFIDRHVAFRTMVEGKPKDVSFADYARFLEGFTPDKAAAVSGVAAVDIVRAARMFAAGPTVSLWTMGLNQRTTGVWANNLIHNLHLLTGQIGKPGMTPFSLTGQPNACGGVRDTGSLCHILPYGRLVNNPQHRAEMEKLWGCQPATIPPNPGLNTVELFKALGENKIKAMLVLTTNPGQSLPNVSPYRDAMGKPREGKPFVVVADVFATRTTELADVVLPSAFWSEKEGVFGMSERRYQLLPKLIDPPAEARPDLEILLDLATRLEQKGVVPSGFISSRFQTAADVWDEMREASRGTAYDFTGITRARLKAERGLRWPCPDEAHPGTAIRFVKGHDPLLDKGPFADAALQAGDISFYGQPDKRAVVWLRPATGPAEPADSEYPFVLSTGRVLEHWHTATMTMKADALRKAQPEAYVEIHPEDAAKLGIATGDPVRIISRRGEARIKARVVDAPRPGMVFVPFHWYDESSLINRVTIDAYDAVSKQPEFKVCAVKLAKV
jgi:nitrate reductase NapA